MGIFLIIMRYITTISVIIIITLNDIDLMHMMS